MSAAAAGHEMMDGRPSAGNREIKGDEDRSWHRASVVTRRREIKSLTAFFKTESDAVWKLSKDECTQYLEHVYVYPRDSPAIGETSGERITRNRAATARRCRQNRSDGSSLNIYNWYSSLSLRVYTSSLFPLLPRSVECALLHALDCCD